MQQITKYRFATGNQIKILAGFSSLNTCDRRLRKLIESGYIKRQYFLYGVPALYFTTKQAQAFFNFEYVSTNVRVDKIKHDINVTDTAIYFIKKLGIQENNIITEREVKHQDGFATPKHRPDFIFTKSDEKCCVEIELTEKAKERLEKNIRDNYLNFDIQYWITGSEKIKRNIEALQNRYSNIEIIDDKEVQSYVKDLYRDKKGE